MINELISGDSPQKKSQENKREKMTVKKRSFSRVGNYKFLNTIGRGQFGKVKLGVHIPTEQYVRIFLVDF